MTRIDWETNQPVIHHLREVLPAVFPVLTQPGHGKSSTGVGGYLKRTQRGSDKPSHHAEGRAADIFLDAFNSGERMLGDGLFGMFSENATDLGVDYVIWNMRIWSVAQGGPRLYLKKPHHDHVHVSFTRAGSQSRPQGLRALAEDVRTGLLQGLRSQTATGTPREDTARDDMMTLFRNKTAVGDRKGGRKAN